MFFTEIGPVHEEIKGTPGRLQFLKILVMENFVYLPAQLPVDLGDHVVEPCLGYPERFLARFQQLGYQHFDPFPGNGVGLVSRFQPGGLHDLLQERFLNSR